MHGVPETIYRYHCPQKDGSRFFYSNSNAVGEGWTLDGPCFKAPLQTMDEAVPVYQYHYDQSKTYGGWRFLFSTDSNHQSDGWTMDKVAFFAFR